jgi:hypothetical protein
MAVARMQVFYVKGVQGKWTNVYHVDAPDLVSAADTFEVEMKPKLLDLLHVTCVLEKVLVSSLSDDTFVERNYGDGGANGDTDDLMPLFNSAKVLFAVDGLGRPDYKFLKGILTDDANESGFIAGSVVGHIIDQFEAAISGMSGGSCPLVSENGDLWTGVSVQSAIQMRQMHRRRRRTTPTP